MEELLDFMENDNLDDDANETPAPSCNASSQSPGSGRSPAGKSFNKSQGSPSYSPKTEGVATFQSVFGSPDKRDLKEFGLLQPRNSTDLSSIKQQLDLSKAIRQDSKVPFKPQPITTIVDPYSRLRVKKSSISIYYDETMTPEAALKGRNLGLEFVSLPSFPSWIRGKGKDQKNYWICGVLARKSPGVRKSSNGNEYSIWEVVDLKDLNNKTSVFLFGATASSSTLSIIPVGSVIDLVTPSALQDTSGGGATKLSIKNATQVRVVAESSDFGYCQAKKKDGNKCTAVVNTWECSFCIHHASSELKKLNVGGSGNSRKFTPSGTPKIAKGQFSQAAMGVSAPSSRMALQGGVNQMNKNPLKFGNPETVKFIANKSKDHPLLKDDPTAPPVERKPLDLNPTKTRHLTDRDRDLLSLLENQASSSPAGGTEGDQKKGDQKKGESKSNKSKGSTSAAEPISELITTSIVNNPNAASRNFLQYLSLQHAPKDQVDLVSSQKSSGIQPLTMSREKVRSMQKALDFVKKNGPLQKGNPNATPAGVKRKRGAEDPLSGRKAKRASQSSQIDVEFDFDSEKMEKIRNAKSAHDDELEEIQQEEYFGKLEKKEALENKLLNTFSIETSAVMCRQCKYIALSQSDFCKELLHQVKVVKARKRFFKCKDCGNRTMSLDRLPKHPCSNCHNSSWLTAPVGRERKGPKLASEQLSVRGNEEKFMGSAGSKMYMHLEV